MDDLKRVAFEIRHIKSKKYLSDDVRRRVLRACIPAEYQEEFNRLIQEFTKLELSPYDVDRSALRALYENMKVDQTENPRTA
jgi:hypothetical protein